MPRGQYDRSRFKKPKPNAVPEGAEFAPADVSRATMAPVSSHQATEAPESPLTTGNHALDAAPVNSKIVMVRVDGVTKAVLATPAGTRVLPKDDPFYTLPEGARVVKKAPAWYVSTQLQAAVGHPDLVTSSAEKAIARFLPYFHPPGE